MARTFTVKTVFATVAVALAIGFFVQIGETPPNDVRAPARSTVPRAVTVVTNTQTSSVFGVPETAHELTDHLSDVQQVALVRAYNSEVDAPSMGLISSAPTIDDPCKVTLSAMGMPAAMAILAISAPCHQDTDYVIAHESLRFSGRTDSTGAAEVMTPILARDARISVLFNNIEFARAAINMPDVSQFDRTILQWRGDQYLQLHVLESGAEIGQPGHVWTGSSHTAELAVLGRRGFVASHGTRATDIPYQAEVYTFPARFGRSAMLVDMPVGLMVTQQNCSRMLDVQIIQVVAGQIWSPRQVAFKAPDCESAGEFVMIPDAVSSYTRLAR